MIRFYDIVFRPINIFRCVHSSIIQRNKTTNKMVVPFFVNFYDRLFRFYVSNKYSRVVTRRERNSSNKRYSKG